MATVAEELAAAQRRHCRKARIGGQAGVLLGPDRNLEHIAVGPLVQQFLHADDEGIEAHHVGGHEHAVGSLGRLDEIEAVFLGSGHRFLEEDVLAGVQKELGRGMVQAWGKAISTPSTSSRTAW